MIQCIHVCFTTITAEFVRRFMGHDIGSSEFEERQQDTVESLVESAWKHLNATAAAHQHVAAAQAWVSAEVNAISGAATMSPPASTSEGSTPSSAAPGMVALTSLEDLEASILAAMHAAGAITDSNAKTARSIAKMITSGRAYKGPGSELVSVRMGVVAVVRDCMVDQACNGRYFRQNCRDLSSAFITRSLTFQLS